MTRENNLPGSEKKPEKDILPTFPGAILPTSSWSLLGLRLALKLVSFGI